MFQVRGFQVLVFAMLMSAGANCGCCQAWVEVRDSNDLQGLPEGEKWLDLRGVAASVFEHIGKVTEVRGLKVGGIGVSDQTARKLATIDGLQVLDISNCRGFTSAGLAVITALPLLELTAEGDLDWAPAHFLALSKCRTLERLNISRSDGRRGSVLNSSDRVLIAEHLCSIAKSLRELKINCREAEFLGDGVVEVLSQSSCITVLEAVGCGGLSVRTMCKLLAISNLTHISIGCVPDSAEVEPAHAKVVAALSEVCRREVLVRLCIPWLQGFNDDMAYRLSKLTRLETLDLRGSQGITSVGCHWLSESSSLKNLNLIDCSKVSRDSLHYLARSKSIEKFAFGGEKSDWAPGRDDVVEVVSALPALTHLAIGLCGAPFSLVGLSSSNKLVELILIGASEETLTELVEQVPPSSLKALVIVETELESLSIFASYSCAGLEVLVFIACTGNAMLDWTSNMDELAPTKGVLRDYSPCWPHQFQQ